MGGKLALREIRRAREEEVRRKKGKGKKTEQQRRVEAVVVEKRSKAHETLAADDGEAKERAL